MIADDDHPRSLVDTNIVVYAHDPRDAAKHAIASGLLERLSDGGRLVFSAQVFNVFASVMMRPNHPGRLVADEVSLFLQELESAGEVLPITSRITCRALDAMPRHGFSFWDALIWAAAAENDIPVIYTEDFQAGRDIEGVRFVNPFAPDAGFTSPSSPDRP